MIRVQPGVILTADEPAVAAGKPTAPAHWGRVESTATLQFGPTHIHAITDPEPAWDPASASWRKPPPAGPLFAARWSVDSLPDPSHYANGYYWLGVPSSLDGTSNQAAATHAWAPDGSRPGVPSWHSFFPYKPSVTAVDHYLQGGGVVHHPKGVNFNSHFVEHMWMDWGRNRRQPFTWVIAAMVASWPSEDYVHFLLDAGRDPDSVHFPRLSAGAVDTPRVIKDGLDYRNLLAISDKQLMLCTRLHVRQSATVRAPSDAALRPKMFIGVFNGTHSYVGAYSPGRHILREGNVDNTAAQAHRYYVLGRGMNHINQEKASHLLVFEIRFWTEALTAAQLERQYAQLSSTYQFERYRSVS